MATMKAEVVPWVLLICGLTWLEADARGVNISTVWFLPEEGFPVFYRYFNEKVTWNEAEAVCGRHHAGLLSVQTSGQTDAARAYLKEIDVTDNVWIGLQRESPEKGFSWTNGEKLAGDGYWLEPIPKTKEKLCAALDPASDFRWNTYYCGGSQVSSFVCELPVPEWAKKDDGCMITSLPSLTVTFIPEMEIVQLFSDCGLDGTRRIACKGGVNRDDMVKRLSCDEDVSTMFSKSTTDTLKEVITHESARPNDLKSNPGPPNKSWATRIPQTRHKRMAETTTDQTNPPPQTETSTQTIMSTEKPTPIKLPTRNFPHSPEDRNLPTTVTTPAIDRNTTHAPKIIQKLTATANASALPAPTIPEPTPTPQTSPNLTTPIQTTLKPYLPLLIITNQPANDSISSNSTASENPAVVFMIDEKEDMPEPYIVPIEGDVIVNNPSLSPVEAMDVDLIELDNVTATVTATTTPEPTPSTVTATPTPSTTTTTPSKTILGLHPLRLGDKNKLILNATATTTPPTRPSPTTTPSVITPTTTPTTTTPTTTSTTTTPTASPPPQQLAQISVGGDDSDGDNMDMPQRPSRGRLITRSNIPSFYPYFFNKVLG